MKKLTTDDISMSRLWWMAAVVFGACLPHWPTLPGWAPILLAMSVSWRLAAKPFQLPLPNRVLRYLFAIAALVGIVLEYRTINGLNAGSALLVVMISLKFLESHNHRDQLVLMLISYFLVFAGLLHYNTLLSGAYLLGFVWLTTVGLLQLGRRGDLMSNWPTVKLAGRLLLQATPIMLVLFVLFPRLPGPLWAIPGSTDVASSGLSETMSPGDITDLGLSDDIAFRAEFYTGQPSADKLYWRGPVLAAFNGRTWSRRDGMWQVAERTLEHFGDPIEYRVTLEPQARSWAFALEMPSQWTDTRRMTLRMQSDYQLRTLRSFSPGARVEYEVTSYPQYLALDELETGEIEYYLDLPQGSNPRTASMIEAWKREGLNKNQLIEKALDVFRGDEFFYTLTPPPLGRHTADDFIFETKEGFCEHYASAFTIMMRAAGIPARVVTGYQGGEINPMGSYFIVRQSNAHAWTEVWLEEQGWVRVDPITAVAPERIALGSSGSALPGGATSRSVLSSLSWVRNIALAWDAANTYWNRWIVDYGPRLQAALLESLGFDRPSWGQLFATSIGASFLCLAGLAIYLTWSSRHRHRRDPAEKCFSQFVKYLARKRIAPRTPTESPTSYGARAAQASPRHTHEIESIVAAYLKARYEPDKGGEQLAILQRMVEHFRTVRAPT